MSDQRLLHYLDLFARLRDDELAHLAGVPRAQVVALREKVDRVVMAFEPWRDLLERLDDASLSRLTGASPHAVAFWRRSQGVKEPAVQPPLSGGGSARSARRPGTPQRVADLDTAPIDVRGDTERGGAGPSPSPSPGQSPVSVPKRPRPSLPYGNEAEDDDDDDILVTVEEPEKPAPAASVSDDDESMDWSDL